MTDRLGNTHALYYDMEGEPITDVLVWARMFEDGEGRTLASTEVTDEIKVITVWVGIDQNFPAALEPGLPLIFSTGVFVALDPPEVTDYGTFPSKLTEERNWPTKEVALAGHERIVEGLRSGALTPDDVGE